MPPCRPGPGGPRVRLPRLAQQCSQRGRRAGIAHPLERHRTGAVVGKRGRGRQPPQLRERRLDRARIAGAAEGHEVGVELTQAAAKLAHAAIVPALVEARRSLQPRDQCIRPRVTAEHGQHVRVFTDLVAGVAPESTATALAEMAHAGAVFATSDVLAATADTE